MFDIKEKGLLADKYPQDQNDHLGHCMGSPTQSLRFSHNLREVWMRWVIEFESNLQLEIS